MEELFQRNLLFFLPYYIFRYEKQLSVYESDEIKLQKLLEEYRNIRARLYDLEKCGEISTLAKYTICDMIAHVILLLAKKYPKVREGVKEIMVGRGIQTEAKKIWDEGFEKGFEFSKKEKEDLKKELEESEKENEELKEERDKTIINMLRDKMEISLIEKYTNLPVSRIKDLARKVECVSS